MDWNHTGQLLLARHDDPRRVAVPPRIVALIHAFDGQRTVAQLVAEQGLNAGVMGLLETLLAWGMLRRVGAVTTEQGAGPRVIAHRRVDGFDVLIVDDLGDPAEVDTLANTLHAAQYSRSAYSTDDTAHIRRFSFEADLADFRASWLHARLVSVMEAFFPKEAFQVIRIYGDCTLPMDTPVPHRDCWTVDRDITVVYFGETEWQPAWGGETVFFDDAGDAKIVALPKPGRAVVFRGAAQHSARPPVRGAAARHTLAIKFLSRTLGAEPAVVEQTRQAPHLAPTCLFAGDVSKAPGGD